MVLEEFTQTVAQTQGVGYTIILNPLQDVGYTIIIVLILTIIFNSLILWLLSGLFKFEKHEYKYALIIAVTASFVSFLLEYIIPVILMLLLFPLYYIIEVILIKYIYYQKWGKSFLVGLIWWILGIIVRVIVGVILVVFSLFSFR